MIPRLIALGIGIGYVDEYFGYVDENFGYVDEYFGYVDEYLSSQKWPTCTLWIYLSKYSNQVHTYLSQVLPSIMY